MAIGLMLKLRSMLDTGTDAGAIDLWTNRFIDSGVDDIGQIHGIFLSGGSMVIIPEVDKFEIVTETIE